MQDHQVRRGGRRPSFAGLLTLLALIGLSGAAAAVAFGSDDSPQSARPSIEPATTVSTGQFPNGTPYQVGVSESNQGLCLSTNLGVESNPARFCGVEVNAQTGDVNVIYSESDGNVLITPLLATRVSRISVSPVAKPDGGAATVDLGEGVDRVYADAQSIPGENVRAAVIAVPLTSPSSGGTSDGAPLSVAFVITAYGEGGSVLASKTTTAVHESGPIDEKR